MSVSITTYDKGIAPFCRYYESVDDGKMTHRDLTLDEALKLAWELKLAGGEKMVEPHPYSNTICYINVNYWMRH